MKKRKNKMSGLLEMYFNKYKCAQKIYFKELSKVEKSLDVTLEPITQFKDDITFFNNNYLIAWGNFTLDESHIYWSVTIYESDDFDNKNLLKGFIPIEWIDYNKHQMKDVIEKMVSETIKNNLSKLRRIMSDRMVRFAEENAELLEEMYEKKLREEVKNED
jgi:hypothetical protein